MNRNRLKVVWKPKLSTPLIVGMTCQSRKIFWIVSSIRSANQAWISDIRRPRDKRGGEKTTAKKDWRPEAASLFVFGAG
jgi:hypothetical protein